MVEAITETKDLDTMTMDQLMGTLAGERVEQQKEG